MTTITINGKSKAGKTLLDLAKILAVKNSGISVENDNDSKRPNLETQQAILEAKNKINLISVKDKSDFYSKMRSQNMYKINTTNKFKKDFKLCEKRDYDLTLFDEVLDLLINFGCLSTKYKPHSQNPI